MRVVQLRLDDELYEKLIDKKIDIQHEIKSALYKLVYRKEHKIADDISSALVDVKEGKTNPIDKLLNEL